MKKFILLFLSLFLLTGCPTPNTQMVPMRDGTKLATYVYLPLTGEGPWPVLLLRTPYGRKNNISLLGYANDYALVVQDVRGRYDSEGDISPFTMTDGEETKTAMIP